MPLKLTWNHPDVSWRPYANCSGLGNLIFFDSDFELAAKAYCELCPVKAECIESDISACQTLHHRPEGYFGVSAVDRERAIRNRTRYKKQFFHDLMEYYVEQGSL